MADLTLARLRRDGEAFMQDVSREYYLAHAGLKADAELQPIYLKHRGVLGAEALELTRHLLHDAGDDAEQQRSARQLLEWQVESQAARALAPLEEREIAWEARAMVTLPNGTALPYQRVAIEIANTENRAARLELEAARAKLVAAELAPIRRERLARERDHIESLEIASGYVATFDALAGFSLSALAAQCRAFLRDTEGMWDDVLGPVVRKRLGIPAREATRADALALFRARDFDAAFAPNEMERAVRRQTSEMGLDAEAGGRVRYDVGEREGKRARAFCAPVQVPDEVYLVLRPHGGQSDWSTFLHELGHALHFGYAAGDLPFEDRWLGDNSVTEGYAMLFDHRMQDARWLRRYTGLGAPDIPVFLRHAGLEELHFLRRYCAKLLYELELYGGEVPWDELPGRYADTLTAATTFRYNVADAFIDVDPRFYSARYLRAWQLQALLNETLVQRFDIDWWRNPSAGPWIVEQLFAPGQSEPADLLATRVSGGTLTFAPLVRAIEGMLA